jgi:hypothetical protein
MSLQKELGLPNPITDSAHEAIMNIVLTGEILAKEGQRIFRPLGLTDSSQRVKLLRFKRRRWDYPTELGERCVNRSNVTGLSIAWKSRMVETNAVEGDPGSKSPVTRQESPSERRKNLYNASHEMGHLAKKTWQPLHSLPRIRAFASET